MNTDVQILKQYRQLKKDLATYLVIQEKYISKCAYELIAIAKLNSDTLTPDNVYSYVAAHEDTFFYKLMDWTKSESDLKAFLGRLLDMIPFLIDELNNVYTITKS